jgi:hypothetical protein
MQKSLKKREVAEVIGGLATVRVFLEKSSGRGLIFPEVLPALSFRQMGWTEHQSIRPLFFSSFTNLSD